MDEEVESFDVFEDVNISDCEEDTRSELKFDEVIESDGERLKRERIEEALADGNSNLQTWQRLALEEHGLVNDDLRRKIWPLLLEVDPTDSEKVPLLSDLINHCEYNQVVLDVNRSLKRFPPGIPYKQRLALQDQLTVLILRVIMKYPHLRYYQGYHDVAITFLLVVGETVSFRIMERLSTDHLHECMEATMEKTSYRLSYIYPLIQKVDKDLYKVMDGAMLGTIFALPWYLTWFGHSLKRYSDVVRLYDFFLASPPLMPIYAAASLVIHRREEVLETGCDMALIHCLLSIIPDDMDFEAVLRRASKLYVKYPPEKLESEVKIRVKREAERQKREERRVRSRLNKNKTVWRRVYGCIPDWLFLHYRNRYGLAFVAATVLFGLYAYFRAADDNNLLHRYIQLFTDYRNQERQ